MRDVSQVFKVPQKKQPSFSTPRVNPEALNDYTISKVINTSEGTIEKVPVNDNDIVNKAYADGLATGLPTNPSITGSLTVADNIISNGSYYGYGGNLTGLSSDGLPQGVLPIGSIPDLESQYITQGVLPTGSIPSLSYLPQGVLPVGSVPTITASKVSDFDTEVSNNGSVVANTANNHTHANKTIIDKFGENVGGSPTYNGNQIDTTIAQRDVYDGLDSTDNTISLAASQGKILNESLLPQGVLPVGSIPTLTATKISDFDTEVQNNGSVVTNTTHRSSDGTDHTYINQDIRTTASPTFVNGSYTGSITTDLYQYTEYSNGNSGTSMTINWNNGNQQHVTMTGNCTFSFTAPTSGGRFDIRLTQDGTGGRTATWPGNVLWGSGSTLSTDANAEDIATFSYRNGSYYGMIGNFS